MSRRITVCRTSEFSFTYEQAAEMNLRFARAMFAARAQGAEKFVIAVKIDTRPIRPAHFFPQPTHSFMSSSAGACADAPGAENLPERMIPSMGGRIFR